MQFKMRANDFYFDLLPNGVHDTLSVACERWTLASASAIDPKVMP